MGLDGNAEWEAMKATRRAMSHRDAVRESAQITRLQWELMGKMSAAAIDLRRIIRILNARKIPFVLTGAHGIGGWTGRPRATHDVDILVKAGRNHARAVKAMRDLYPHLEVHNVYGVVAFFVPGEKESVIDVTYPHRADIEETLANPVQVIDKGLRYRVPSLEAALANKYGAMLSLSRDPQKRLIDAADFGFMVKHSQDAGREPIDLVKLQALGGKVWPGGGGAEILGLVDKVKAGSFVDLNALLRRE